MRDGRGDDQPDSSSEEASGEDTDGHPLDAYLARRSEATRPRPLPLPVEATTIPTKAHQGYELELELDYGMSSTTDDGDSTDEDDRDDDVSDGDDLNANADHSNGRPQHDDEKVISTTATSEEDMDEVLARMEADTDSTSKTIEDNDGDEEDVDRGALVPTAKRRRVLPDPIGVTVLAEGQLLQRNATVTRLLRAPRYFDEDFEEAAMRCFKCGGTGHKSRECTAAPRNRPCFMCAEFGHETKDCPNSVCWRCERAGHQARDCPYNYHRGVAPWEKKAERVCLRCGRNDCPCASQDDYVRAEGGCTLPYRVSDLKLVTCYNCGQKGHTGCGKMKCDVPGASCSNCGEGGHDATQCGKPLSHAVRAERQRAGRQQHRHPRWEEGERRGLTPTERHHREGRAAAKDQRRDGGRRYYDDSTRHRSYVNDRARRNGAGVVQTGYANDRDRRHGGGMDSHRGFTTRRGAGERTRGHDDGDHRRSNGRPLHEAGGHQTRIGKVGGNRYAVLEGEEHEECTVADGHAARGGPPPGLQKRLGKRRRHEVEDRMTVEQGGRGRRGGGRGRRGGGRGHGGDRDGRKNRPVRGGR